VGATTVAIDFVVYQLLLALDVPLNPAKAASFVVATVCAYLFNRSFTFRAGGGPHVVRRFVLLYTVALAVNVAVNALVLWVVTAPAGEATRFDIAAAFLVAQVVSSTLNFLGMRHWVFRRTP
jgi:putative flippase GtrA